MKFIRVSEELPETDSELGYVHVFGVVEHGWGLHQFIYSTKDNKFYPYNLGASGEENNKGSEILKGVINIDEFPNGVVVIMWARYFDVTDFIGFVNDLEFDKD